MLRAKTGWLALPEQQHSFVLSQGAVEGLKWLALVLMVIDHINTYLFGMASLTVYGLGRMAMPLFAFVIGYNLARPSPDPAAVRMRMVNRLLVYGAVATVPYTLIAPHGWWPLNILYSFLVAVMIIHVADKGGWGNILTGILVLIAGGTIVDFLWLGPLTCLAAYWYCRNPGWKTATICLIVLVLLSMLNDSWYTLGVVPVIALAPRLEFNLPRMKYFFYVFYPLHLALLWIVKKALA